MCFDVTVLTVAVRDLAYKLLQMASAKKIRDEIMSMTIVVNSNPAQQEIYSLTKRSKELTAESRALNKEREKVAETLGEESQEYQDLTQKINDNSSALQINKNKVKDLTDSLNINEMTVKQLRQELTLLNRELTDRVAPGTAQYDALQRRIGEVRARLNEVRTGAAGSQDSIDELQSAFEEYGGTIAVVVGVITGYVMVVQELIDRNNEMADAMSAVEKTTGMTTNEVKELSEAFTDFDTRTKKLDLLKIAEVGGRLGVAKQEILDFTREIDKAYVSLGDSWNGGVDDLADSLGTVASLYKETKDLPIAESINMIGSALNELAAQGASSEQNITDFVNRLGSMPPAMKPPLNTLLAFGSAFEESGIKSEIGSSGFANFVNIASKNAAGFAKVMNQPVSKVKELINTNPAEFFLQFSQGLRGLNADELARVLESLKLNSNEVQRVIGAATEKTERFRASIDVANEAVAEGTSLQDEFNKVNNNAAAIYEKIQRKFSESLSSKEIAEFLGTAVSVFGKFMGVVEDSTGVVTGFRTGILFLVKTIVLITAAFFTYNALTGVYNTLMLTAYQRVIGLTVVEKARNALTKVSSVLQTAYNIILGASGLLVGNLGRAIGIKAGAQRLETAATEMAISSQIRLNAAMSANPLGILITLITLAATAYMAYKAITNETSKAQKNLHDIMREGVANAASEITSLKLMYNEAMKAKVGTDERRKAIEALKKQFPSYFGHLDSEKAKNEDLTKSYWDLRKAIVASARAKAAEKELEKREGERLTAEEAWLQRYKAELKTYNELKAKASGTTVLRLDGGDGKSFTQTLKNSDLLNASKERLQLMLNEYSNNLRANKIADKFLHDVLESNKKNSELYEKDKNSVENQMSGYNVPKTDEELKAEKDAAKLKKEQGREAEKQRKLKEAHDREMAEISKKGETALALETQIELDKEDAKISIMEEGFEKELALINLQEQRRAAELDKKKIGNTEIDLLQEKIDKAVGDDKILFEALMNSWIKNNKSLDQLKLNNVSVFAAKRKAAEAKSETERLKDQDEIYQKEVGQLNRQKNDELAQYENLAQLKAGLQGRISEFELRNIKTWNDGKEALSKVYQKKEIELHVAHLQEMISLYEGLDMSILNKDQQEQVLKFVEEATNKISELKAKVNENGQTEKEGLKGKTKLGDQGNTDILGMSIGDWETFFSNIDTGANKLGTISAAVGALQNAFSTYYQFVQQKEQAQLKQVDTNSKRKEARLKRQLDSGQINQEQYEAALQRLNQETELEKYKLEYDAAKRQRNFQIAQTHANTAMAIMNIWATSNNPWVAAAMSIVVGALGLIQVANIAKQPLPEAPGFEDGFGMDYEMNRAQDGKKFNVQRKPLKSGPVYRPTHFIAGENNKVEMVIDNQTYKGFSPSFRKALHNEIAYSKGAEGYEGGYYPVLNDKNYQNSNDSVYAEALNNNTAALNKVATMTPRAYVVKDMDSAKHTIEMIDEYNSYVNQAKKK